tara:strand:+ start:979 stop:1860 length:882 start_codon:yes stop_codon:yes gene_type:complete
MPDLVVDDELWRILEKEGIVELDEDIRGLKRTQIKKHFGSQNSDRIILSKFMKSIIWQAYTKIQAGDESPIMGNIRTFWYRWVKPALAKVPKKYFGKMDLYDLMLRLFAEMVMDLKLFNYADFDFTDENWENRRIGEEKPGVIVFSEKRGWVRFLREFHQKHGVSVLALGGFPSALTSEYTVRDVQKVLGTGKAVRLVGIVDYDPSGDLIAESFREQLETQGLVVESLETLIQPKHYTADELKLFRFRLPRSQKTKTQRWMEKTGGIDGKEWGLESESMPTERLKSLLEEVIS